MGSSWVVRGGVPGRSRGWVVCPWWDDVSRGGSSWSTGGKVGSNPASGWLYEVGPTQQGWGPFTCIAEPGGSGSGASLVSGSGVSGAMVMASVLLVLGSGVRVAFPSGGMTWGRLLGPRGVSRGVGRVVIVSLFLNGRLLSLMEFELPDIVFVAVGGLGTILGVCFGVGGGIGGGGATRDIGTTDGLVHGNVASFILFLGGRCSSPVGPGVLGRVVAKMGEGRPLFWEVTRVLRVVLVPSVWAGGRTVGGGREVASR